MTRTRITSLLVALFALAGATTLAACGDDDGGGGGGGGQPAGGNKQLNLTIGDLVPLTGDLSPFGPPGRKAADLALKEINNASKQAGANHTVKIEHGDTQTDPQAGVSAARKLVSANNASCLTGAWASSVSIPVGRTVSSRERVLQISPASTSDEITGLEDRGFVNRTVPPDSLQGPALADAIEKDMGSAEGKTINIGARNDAYGTGLAETFQKAWEEKGGKIGQKVVYDPKQPSYDAEARKIVSGNPAAYVIIDFPETYQKVGPALVRTGNFDSAKAWATDGLKSDSLPKDAGKEATNGMKGTAPGSPDQGAASEAFDQLYKQAGGPNRQTFDSQNFDAVILCYLSAVAAGSTEGQAMADQVQAVSSAPGKKFTFQQLPDAIKALQNGEDIDYDGASGPIDLNEAGDATAGVYDIYEYQGSKLENTGEIPLPEQ